MSTTLISGGSSTGGPGGAASGDVGTLDQLDLTNSDPLAVAIVDGNGDQITSFGGGTVTANQGTPAATANAWPVRVGDGTDEVHIFSDGESQASPKGFLVAGHDRINNVGYPLPISAPSFAIPTTNTVAVPVLIRNGLEQHNPSSGTFNSNSILSIGGGTANSTTRPVRAIFSGNQFTDSSTESAQPYGLITREQGQLYVNSGNINVVGQRFTASSQFMGKGAALFRILEGNPFVGTLKPVVSLNNGSSYQYVSAINVLTGAVVTELATGNIAGTFCIPMANGASNFGWEIVTRTTGDVSIFVSANSVGIGALFALTSPIGTTAVGGTVTDAPQSYLPDSSQPLSLTSDGALRVSTDDSLNNHVWKNTFSNPWEGLYVSPGSGW